MFKGFLKHHIRKNKKIFEFRHKIWKIYFCIWDFQVRTRKNFIKKSHSQIAFLMPKKDSKNCDLDPNGRKREHSVYTILLDETGKLLFLSSADYPDSKK